MCVQKSAWIVCHSMIFTSGAVREHLGDLLVSVVVLGEAFWCPGGHFERLWRHSGELFGGLWSPFGVDLSGLRAAAVPPS